MAANYLFSSTLAVEKKLNGKYIRETPCQIYRRLGFAKTARLNNATYDVKLSEYKLCYSTIAYVDMAYNEFLKFINDKSFSYISKDEERRVKFILSKFHLYFGRIFYQKSVHGQKLLELFDEAQAKWEEATTNTIIMLQNVAYQFTSDSRTANHYAAFCKVYNFIELGEYMRIALRFNNNDDEFRIIESSICRLLVSLIGDGNAIIKCGKALTNLNVNHIIPEFRRIINNTID